MKVRLIQVLLLCLLGLVFALLVFYTVQANADVRVVVEWSTASELDTVGFNLYRSETSSGPGILLNGELIPAAEDSQTGGEYSFTDDDVIPGRKYYYFLEDVSFTGLMNRHGPVEVKAQPNGKTMLFLVIGLGILLLISLAVYTWPRRRKRAKM
jgi:hypothetical protein